MYKESESKKGGRDEVTADRGLPRIWASSWCTVLSVSPFAIRPLVYKFAEWRAIRADCALFGFPLSLSSSYRLRTRIRCPASSHARFQSLFVLGHRVNNVRVTFPRL